MKHDKKSPAGFLIIGLINIVIAIFIGCEGKERYYRPDLPEKLCCLGIIDADDISQFLHYNPVYHKFLFGRYILFEKSYQNEYKGESIDSLLEFSFSISSDKNITFNYKSDGALKNYLKIDIPDSIDFLTTGKYYLKANEKNSSGISAEISVPEPPPVPTLNSAKKVLIPLSHPMAGWSLDIVDTVKSAQLKISFDHTDQNQFYGLFLDSKYTMVGMGSSLFSDYLDFSILECNTPGFFAEIYGLTRKTYPITDEGIGGGESPVYAYFIDGDNIPGNKCKFTLSTLFHGTFSVWQGAWFYDLELYKSICIKLLSIPPELYNFEKSLNTYKNVKGDPFAEPVFLNGNIKGGNGVFAICRSTELVVKLNPPY